MLACLFLAWAACRPGEDAAIEGVEHHGEIEKARPGSLHPNSRVSTKLDRLQKSICQVA
jgi:hypothetical protein